MIPHPPISTLFPYTTLFRSLEAIGRAGELHALHGAGIDVLHHHRAAAHQIGRAWEDLQRGDAPIGERARSEEHTSELQSRPHLVCRLLLEKKNKIISYECVL